MSDERESGLTTVRRFFNLLEVDKQEILSVYVYAIFNGLVGLSLPLGIQAIINLITGGQISTSWIVLVVVVIAGVGFSGLLQIMQLTITENLQQKIFTRSAFEFAYRIPRMKLEAVDKTYIPELVNRFFDTLSVQKGLSKILMDFSTASLQVTFGLILLSLYHPFFILFSFILIAFLYLIFKFIGPRGLNTSITESKYKYEVAHWLEEIARAMDTFKLAGETEVPLNKTDDVVKGYLGARKSHFRTLLIQYINLVGFKMIIAAGLLIIGGLLVINQQMNIGQFVASEIIIILILNSTEKLILSMETIYDVLTAIEKIGDVTDIELERETGDKLDLTESAGLAIKTKSLSYQYNGHLKKSVKNLDIEIASGEKICISGGDNSGKSLLLTIIAGLYDNFEGSLSYNNIPIGNIEKRQLYTIVGTHLSNEEIFNGSILENISLNRPGIDFKEVKKATSILELNDYIELLNEGFNTTLLPEGKKLPKNIKLKLMIARSLVGNPKMILLEDDINHLCKTDKHKLIDYLLTVESTVIVISNEKDVASRFDKTLVLKDGKLIANGKLESFEKETWFENIFN